MRKITYILLALTLLISACNAPTEGEDMAVATSAALTVQAAIDNVPLASPTAAPAVQATPTLSQALGSVEDPTNCRTGPGTNYQRITQLQPGSEYTLVGFYSEGYWIVSTNEGECWVLGDLVTPVGSYENVPSVAEAPTAASSGLDGVSISAYDWQCNFETDEATVSLSWADKDGESGYKVYRNDTEVADLGADVTFYQETITLLSGQRAGYYIIAYNSSDTFTSSVITVDC